YFRTLLDRATPETGAGWNESIWLDYLEVEHDNLRLALERTVAAGTPDDLLQIAVKCWELWWPRGYWSEARQWLERVHREDGRAATDNHAQALRFLGLVTD